MPKNNLPQAFVKSLHQTFSDQQIAIILEGFHSKRLTTFRANTLKTSSENVIQKLNKNNIKFQILEFPDNTFVLLDEKKKLIELDLYTEGSIYLQSLSSLLPPIILDPKSHENILDLTAAPGSKTTQMAAMMKNTGKIIANDRHLIRLEKLKYNLKKQGVSNTEITTIPGQDLWQQFPTKFDKTLLDAPCSLEGTFDLNKPKSFQNWSEEMVNALSQRQKDLLWSAYKATKPGGTIVYSTCTLNTEENEQVINWFLEKLKNKVELEKIDLDIPQSIPGFTTIHGKTFDQSLKNTLRILPSPLFEGFYLAKLKKIA